jgi:hypothetical protein
LGGSDEYVFNATAGTAISLMIAPRELVFDANSSITITTYTGYLTPNGCCSLSHALNGSGIQSGYNSVTNPFVVETAISPPSGLGSVASARASVVRTPTTIGVELDSATAESPFLLNPMPWYGTTSHVSVIGSFPLRERDGSLGAGIVTGSRTQGYYSPGPAEWNHIEFSSSSLVHPHYENWRSGSYPQLNEQISTYTGGTASASLSFGLSNGTADLAVTNGAGQPLTGLLTSCAGTQFVAPYSGQYRVRVTNPHHSDGVNYTVWMQSPLTLAGDSSIDEGEAGAFSVSNLPPLTSSDAIRWDFGDGTFELTGSDGVSHAFADNGAYTVTPSLLRDGQAPCALGSMPVNVWNTSPIITDAGGPDQVVVGVPYIPFVSFDDAGAADTHTITWDFGDGTVEQFDAATQPEGLQPQHEYAATGAYEVRVTVVDDDGGSDSRVLTVTVVAASVLPEGKPILDFAKQLGGPGFDNAYDMVTDGAGNVYIAGECAWGADFDPGPNTRFACASLNSTATDGFVAKYSPDGELVWVSALLMSNGVGYFESLTLDSSGNVYAVGGFNGVIQDFYVSTSAAFDALLVKYDANGNQIWLQHYGADNSALATGVVTDEQGNVYFGGTLSGAADFDFGAGTSLLTGSSQGSGYTVKLDPNGELLWANAVTSDSWATVTDLARSPTGGVLVAGSAAGTTDFDPGVGMQELTAPPSGSLGYVLHLNQVGALSWVAVLNGGNAEITGIAVDAAGSILATGSFSGTVDFDPGAGLHELTHDRGSVFVWKLDSGGGLTWARTVEGGGDSFGMEITVDLAGNAYTTGWSYSPQLGTGGFGRVDMDPGTGTFYLDSGLDGFGNAAGLVWKLDNDGNFAWARAFPTASYGIAVDDANRIYIAPGFEGPPADYDPGPQGHLLLSNGDEDIALIRLSQEVVLDPVAFAFAIQLGGLGFDAAYDMVHDAAGNIYMAGECRAGVDFDPGPGTRFACASLNSTATDGFVAKYSTDGELIWVSALIMSHGVGYFESLTLDSSGNVYAAGGFQGVIQDFYVSTSTAFDALLVKYDANGNQVWLQHYGADDNAQATAVATDEQGNVYFGGLLAGTADFDFGAGTSLLSGSSQGSGFTAKLDSSGNLLWAEALTGDSWFSVTDLARSPTGGVLVAGSAAGTTDFDPGVGMHELTAPPSGSLGYVLHLNQAGELSWVRALDAVLIADIAVDPAGNILTTGSFAGIIDFDPGAGVFELSQDRTSAFVLKLSAGGDFAWARTVEGGGDSFGEGIAVDLAANVYVVGAPRNPLLNPLAVGRVDMDPGPGTFYLDSSVDSSGNTNGFIWKLDSAGNFAWARALPTKSLAITVDEENHVFVAPGFEGPPADYDPGPQGHLLLSNGDEDIALIRLSQGITLNVQADTIAANLQELVTVLQNTAPAPPPIILPVTTETAVAAIAAVQSLPPNTGDFVVEIVLKLADGDYAGETVVVPAGVRLVINGTGGSVTFVGASPAFIVDGGEVVITSVHFANTTDAATIVVRSGSLVLRNSVIAETTGGTQAAILVLGGSANLGTPANPGHNTLEVWAGGELIRNLTNEFISAIGNRFVVDGVDQTDGDYLESLIYHQYDAEEAGIVDYLSNEAPTLANAIADVTVDEDAADSVLDLSATFADVDILTSDDSLTLLIADNTNTGVVTATLVGTTLTLDYAADQYGSATITVRATDASGEHVETSFDVTVSPVNDAPTLAVSMASIIVDEDRRTRCSTCRPRSPM